MLDQLRQRLPRACLALHLYSHNAWHSLQSRRRRESVRKVRLNQNIQGRDPRNSRMLPSKLGGTLMLQ